MRKFIVSDIHGFGNLYYTIMNYLDKLSEIEEVELYINGDLIDRGEESAEILLDVIRRIKENKPRFKIKYLGGNHELMMHEVFEKRRKKRMVPPYVNWFLPVNGGKKTDNDLAKLLDNNQYKIMEVADFISNLDIYHKFDEKINGKNIVLVHAACPRKINDECHLKIKSSLIYYYVWAREDALPFPIKSRIGNSKYFTIIGHTANNTLSGYSFNRYGNYMNIDGGVVAYLQNLSSYNHFPLVEVCEDYLRILTFNDCGEIIYGNYFDGVGSTLYSDGELKNARAYLENNITKKLH